MSPEILNKPIRTEDQFKTEILFLEVESTYKQKKRGLFNCCKSILKICKKEKNSNALLDSSKN